MKPETSSRSLIESAASCRAAIQPSRDPFQRRDVIGREVQAHHVAQEGRRFLCCKAQLGGVQLGHLVPGAQPGQGQAGRRGRYHEVRVLRQSLQQERDDPVYALGIYLVVVVEDHRDLPGRAASSLTRVLSTASIRGGSGERSAARTASRTPLAGTLSAATR